MFPNSEIIKRGVFYYDNKIPCDIRIFRHHMCYGSGDPYDEDEIRNDLEGEFFYIEFGSTAERGKYVSTSSAFLSLEDAIANAPKLTHSVIDWKY